MHPPLAGRKSRVLTAKVSGRRKSYGDFLYVHIPKDAEVELGWSRGDIVQVILLKGEDSIVLKRVFKTEG